MIQTREYIDPRAYDAASDHGSDDLRLTDGDHRRGPD
jgi:hypothetical protein